MPPATIATFLMPPAPSLDPGRTGQFNNALPVVSLRKRCRKRARLDDKCSTETSFRALRRTGGDPAGGGSDVGLGRDVYKVGVAEAVPKPLAAAGWAGEADWTITRKQAVEGLDEEEALARLGLKEKVIDPNLYPKLKGAAGVF